MIITMFADDDDENGHGDDPAQTENRHEWVQKSFTMLLLLPMLKVAVWLFKYVVSRFSSPWR